MISYTYDECMSYKLLDNIISKYQCKLCVINKDVHQNYI